MAISWGNPHRFSFGQLAPHEVQLYEDNPNLAFQRLLDWYGQGNPNFAMTTLGRYIASQQDTLTNRLTAEQAAQVARNTAGQQAWQSEYDRLQKAMFAIPNTDDANRYNLQLQLQALSGKPFKPEETLTLTKFLEQEGGNLGRQFGYLTSNQRGANPGLFRVRREIW